MERADESYLQDRTPIALMAAIHREIQGEKEAIRQGIAPWMIRFVKLNFDVGPAVRQHRAHAMEEELHRELTALLGKNPA